MTSPVCKEGVATGKEWMSCSEKKKCRRNRDIRDFGEITNQPFKLLCRSSQEKRGIHKSHRCVTTYQVPGLQQPSLKVFMSAMKAKKSEVKSVTEPLLPQSSPKGSCFSGVHASVFSSGVRKKVESTLVSYSSLTTRALQGSEKFLYHEKVATENKDPLEMKGRIGRHAGNSYYNKLLQEEETGCSGGHTRLDTHLTTVECGREGMMVSGMEKNSACTEVDREDEKGKRDSRRVVREKTAVQSLHKCEHDKLSLCCTSPSLESDLPQKRTFNDSEDGDPRTEINGGCRQHRGTKMAGSYDEGTGNDPDQGAVTKSDFDQRVEDDSFDPRTEMAGEESVGDINTDELLAELSYCEKLSV